MWNEERPIKICLQIVQKEKKGKKRRDFTMRTLNDWNITGEMIDRDDNALCAHV